MDITGNEIIQIYSQEKPLIRISVRNLVEFILRTGNIDNRHSARADNAMQEGSRIHRMIQRRMGSNYQAEVSLKMLCPFEQFDISVEGRADGVLSEQMYPDAKQIDLMELADQKEKEALLEGSTNEAVQMERPVNVEVNPIELMDVITIDEIKGTYKELRKIREAAPLHLAQAKCYAYMYAAQKHLAFARVRITYCNIETEELKYFHEEYSFVQLRNWFEDMMEQYRKWADFEFQWKKKRQESIVNLEFPFEYREGQRDLVKYVYQTIYHGRKLFAVAPTGIGKTISTVFPSIQAMSKNMGDKLFYLTAKTITRTVADDTFELLRQQGLQWKSVILTAREKICPMEEVECNPVACPYARGHYDRINDAIYDLLIAEDRYTREKIEEYAKKHQVCPFEMGLDMSLFADGIICDYNYVFDPHAYLRRFFADGIEGNYLFLIDEAHNLLDRGREMYSAVLYKEDFLELKRKVKGFDARLENYLEKCNREMLALKRECESFRVVELIAPLVNAVNRLYSVMEKFLQDKEESAIRPDVLEFYFEISHFLDIYERVDENYVTYIELQTDGRFYLKLFCVNPSVNLRECMGKARSTILFSATLLPIQYYKNLLGGNQSDYEVYVKSMFDPEKRALLIGSDVTSKYTRRSEEEYRKIARYIHEVTRNRHGNYMVFFPSHLFLREVYETYQTYYYNEEEEECILQTDAMNERAREAFLNRFAGNESYDIQQQIQIEIEMDEEKSLIGFCVMGGIFSEGIDLTEDKLIGVMVVGTGLPQVCNERELIKGYFDDQGENGFDYAYRYPGMNKVLQAAGRVIRTVNDIGVIALLDERFLGNSYQRLFPREWEDYTIVDQQTIAKRVERFWDEWL
ncbi:MAG: ATP-dependent DNA helicase [Lachnospiraceae bacterium]|nr:ATP-dependent DNA helicase [Lachnospiraceae bacterium]